MFRKDLLAFLIKEQEEAKEKKHYLFSSGYHSGDDIYICIHTLLSQYWDQEDEIDDIDDIIDDLYEICDSQTPVYYWQIAEWFASNWYAVNETVEELGMDSKNFDIMKTIQMAYYYTLENETRQELEELIEYYNDKQEGIEEKEEQNNIYF